jgi:hypothetical protein
MRLLTSFVFLAAAAVAGCVGGVDSDPGDGDGSGSGSGSSNDPRAAREIFKADVFTSLGKCSSGACHDVGGASAAASKFYSPSADATYDKAVEQATLVGTFQATAPILQKVVAEQHKGLTYTTDEQGKITNWLAKETFERKDGPPPFDAQKALKDWSGCMTLESFTASNMTAAWSNLGADNLQKCLSCHQSYAGNFVILNNAQNFFDAISKHSTFLLKYFTVDNAQKKVIVNTLSFKAANVIAGHPTFNTTTNAGAGALQKLYDLTAAKQTAGGWDPGRLVD